MTHIAGFGRDELLLLPEAVDDYVEVDNPVRFIEVPVQDRRANHRRALEARADIFKPAQITSPLAARIQLDRV
jgi:hypothetical protein